MEWHAFATIPSSDGLSAHVVISQAGDWTKAIIQNPPSHIWIRKPAVKNFLSFAPLFDSLLLVATGAAIGPLLSLLSSPVISGMRREGRQVRVMWCVHDPQASHWQFVQDIIRAVDPMPKIFDSRQGRPELAFEASYMKEVCGIEAVMVVSNAKVTKHVVETIKGKGGAAYGAVFDS
jgi:ferredoxin-NADP reductase